MTCIVKCLVMRLKILPDATDLLKSENSREQEVGRTSPSSSMIVSQYEDLQPEDSRNQDAYFSSTSIPLFNQLPDPNQEIAIQRGKDTDTFTYFPELPIEIRLKIWRYSFPRPRPINLVPRCQGYCLHELVGIPDGYRISDSDKYRHATVRRSRIPLPTTLRINHESRQETLMDYILVFREDTYDLRSGRGMTVVRLDNGPCCFDPTRDTTFINWCAFRWMPIVGRDITFGWISKPEYTESAKRISRIEIRKMLWCGLLRRFLRIYNSGDLSLFEASSISRHTWNHEGPLRGLLKLSGLKSIHITIQFPNVAEAKIMGGCKEAGKECKAEVLSFLGMHKTKFEGGTPTVTVSFCKQLYHQVPYRTF